MNILLYYNSMYQESADLATVYSDFYDGGMINGDPVRIWTRSMDPIGNGVASRYMETVIEKGIQIDDFVSKFVMRDARSGEFDMVILSSHFPIKIYGKTDNVDASNVMQSSGGACSFDHFLSQSYFNKIPVFRLDGLVGEGEMIQWFDRLNSSGMEPGQIVVDTDPGLGRDWKPFDQAFSDGAEWLKDHGIDCDKDETPDKAVLSPGRKYGGYYGWYDEYENGYFQGDWLGAIGWQLRSGNFRNRGELKDGVWDDNWVSGAIRAGFAFTIGSCYEPGAAALPDPVNFFRLVYEQRMTVGLAAWYSSPFRSALVFVGDPLWVTSEMVLTTPPPYEDPDPVRPPVPPVDPIDPPTDPPPANVETVLATIVLEEDLRAGDEIRIVRVKK